VAEAVIEAVDLWYTYPDGTRALRGVSMKVHDTEAVALLGANGAGKSTLLRHLNALLRPASGRVMVWGRDAAEDPAWVRRQVGLVFQNPDEQLFAPSVGEDVAFGPRNLGLPREEVQKRVEEALRMVGMEGCEERAPHHLSYGEKKRVAIAGVLAMKPRVLLLDEPTSGLDPAGAEELVGLLQRLRRRGITLVVASHDVDLVPELAERAYLLHRGRVVAEGALEDVLCAGVERYSLRMPCAARMLDMLRGMGVKVRVRLRLKEAAREVARHIPG